jgi:hypothetical protein
MEGVMKIVDVPVMGAEYMFEIEELDCVIECDKMDGGFLCTVYYEPRELALFDWMEYTTPTPEVMLEGLEANIKTAIKQIFRLL